uniref:Uncharacterized protein n=1 Tax=Heterorhabditis bacteriophora TaxID=37862 RepID=A0A1I7W910_HETBA
MKLQLTPSHISELEKSQRYFGYNRCTVGCTFTSITKVPLNATLEAIANIKHSCFELFSFCACRNCSVFVDFPTCHVFSFMFHIVIFCIYNLLISRNNYKFANIHSELNIIDLFLNFYLFSSILLFNITTYIIPFYGFFPNVGIVIRVLYKVINKY